MKSLFLGVILLPVTILAATPQDIPQKAKLCRLYFNGQDHSTCCNVYKFNLETDFVCDDGPYSMLAPITAADVGVTSEIDRQVTAQMSKVLDKGFKVIYCSGSGPLSSSGLNCLFSK